MTTDQVEQCMPHDDILQLYLSHLRAEVAPKTYRTYAPVLIRAQRDLPYGVIGAGEDDLREWLWGRPRPLAASTLATYLAAIMRLHRWLAKRGITEFDPTELLKRPKAPRGLPRPVPPDQLHVVLTDSRQPIRLWCTIATYSGARCCELANLDRRDITEQTVQLHGKGSKQRQVPTHPALWAVVESLPPGPVARLRAADPAKRISDYIALECRKLGPEWSPRVTAHRLRHTIASQILDQTQLLPAAEPTPGSTR